MTHYSDARYNNDNFHVYLEVLLYAGGGDGLGDHHQVPLDLEPDQDLRRTWREERFSLSKIDMNKYSTK